MSYAIHPGAESDSAAASDFYLKQAGETVARKFLDEFERVARLLERNPAAGAPQNRGRRVFQLQLIPYSVVYRHIDAGIQVLVVRYQSRQLGYCMRRS